MNHPFFNPQLKIKKRWFTVESLYEVSQIQFCFIICEAILCLSFWQCGIILLENGLVVLLIHSGRWLYFVGKFEGYFCSFHEAFEAYLIFQTIEYFGKFKYIIKHNKKYNKNKAHITEKQCFFTQHNQAVEVFASVSSRARPLWDSEQLHW